MSGFTPAVHASVYGIYVGGLFCHNGVEGFDRDAGAIRVVPHGGNDGQKIRPGVDERLAVVQRYAADGDARHVGHAAPNL